ncbi:MAG: hypothetical protein ACO39Y_06925 [Ilumatobacteraceae bacterium]|jgi:hypothetical protein|nr:hypothetical protein [Actinomycetota bacterium]MDA3011120.1 hypothetical protein [Actinomycetota bacterium]MDA3023955.1 hypothetical protein [Actinomycetota bacterium]
MIKRFVWFVTGGLTGALAVLFTRRRVKKQVARVTDLTPIKVVKEATDSVRRTVTDVGDALRDGRDAMRHKEAELRARVEGRAESLDDALGHDDAVLVDGEPIEPGRVVVLRQIDPGFVENPTSDSSRRRRTRR